MPPLISEVEIDSVLSGDESNTEPMFKEMLGDIRDGSQSHLIINSREAHYNIRDCMKQGQAEWKGELLFTQKICKGLHKIFKAAVNDIL